MSAPLSVIILAAGKGTRMQSDLHKVLHPIAGKAMLHHLLDAVSDLRPDSITLVVGALSEQVKAAAIDYPSIHFAYQTEQRGTGHAVMTAKDAFEGRSGDVLVLYGDVPFIPSALMQQMLDQRRRKNAAATVLGFTPKDPGRYGRLVVGAGGTLEKIVEYKDATDAEKNIALCNSGMMALDAALLPDMLAELRDDNAAGEYYLTDLVAIANKKGHTVTTTEATEEEVIGVNSRRDLALAETIFQRRIRNAVMDAGITLIDPDTVYFAADTKIERDVVIEPHVFFGPNVTIGQGSIIRAFSHIEGATIGKGAQIGPYARLRPGTELADNTKIGNFVETKKTKVGKGSKINHLSYVGDSVLGEKVNVGAGTITCNYNGFTKAQTTIEDSSFIGSNSALVAPVTIGAGAIIAAGSTITKDVAKDSLGIERAPQKQMDQWASNFREREQRKKEADKKG